MNKFIALYSGGKAVTSPQEGEAAMKVWNKWFQGLGASVVDNGAPFSSSRTVSASGAKEGTDGNVSNGYSIIQARDLEEAAKLVKGCPILSEGGKVHVFELAAM